MHGNHRGREQSIYLARRKKHARKEIGVGQCVWMAKKGGDLAHLVCAIVVASEAPDFEQRLGNRMSRPLRQQPGKDENLYQMRRGPKGGISPKKFIAAQS